MMRCRDHRLRIAGVEVALRLCGLALTEFVESCEHWLPDIRRSRNLGAPALTVCVSCGQPRLRYRRNGFEIRGNSGVFHTCLDSGIVLSRYLERELNRCGRYSVHAGCVAVRGCAHLLLGGAGAGKTTIAASWSRLDPSARVLAGDRAVVFDDRVVGGTTTLAFRNLGIDAAHLPPGRHRSLGGWTSVQYPRDVFRSSYPIGSLSVVKLTSGPAVRMQIAEPDHFLRVYEQIAHFGDVFPNIALGHLMPIPIFSTMKAQAQRIEFTRQLVHGRNVFSVSGGLQEVVADLAQRASSFASNRNSSEE